MDNTPLIKRAYYQYLGALYQFTRYTDGRALLGIKLSTIVKFAAILLVLAALIYRWGDTAFYLSLLLLIWVFVAYWLARRAGYFRFVSGPPLLSISEAPEKLPAYESFAIAATGVFSLQSWEQYVLFSPAQYWQAPRGDHAVMVEYRPQRYLYQFFNAKLIHEVKRGWLIYGKRPFPAISISFLSIWGPEFSEVQYSIFGAEQKPVHPKLRTIYFSFADEETERIVCRNIIGDVMRVQGSVQPG